MLFSSGFKGCHELIFDALAMTKSLLCKELQMQITSCWDNIHFLLEMCTHIVSCSIISLQDFCFCLWERQRLILCTYFLQKCVWVWFVMPITLFFQATCTYPFVSLQPHHSLNNIWGGVGTSYVTYMDDWGRELDFVPVRPLSQCDHVLHVFGSTRLFFRILGPFVLVLSSPRSSFIFVEKTCVLAVQVAVDIIPSFSVHAMLIAFSPASQ